MRIRGEAEQSCADRRDRGVQTRGKQRADQQLGLLGRDLLAVGSGMDGGADALRREILPPALRGDPGNVRCRVGACCAAQLVVGAEGVEGQRAVGQQMLPPFAHNPHRVREHRQGKRLGECGDGVDLARLQRRRDAILGGFPRGRRATGEGRPARGRG